MKSKSNTEKQLSKILDWICSEHTISCSKCKHIGKIYNMDDQDASEKFLKEGWLVIRDKPKCPNCA